MNKNPMSSKTIIGFGLLTLTLIAESMGWIPSTVLIQIVEYLEGFLGIYGIRDAI